MLYHSRRQLFANAAIAACACRGVAMHRRAILMVPESERPHPRRSDWRSVLLEDAIHHNTIRKRPPTEAGGLFLLVSASFYKPYRPATSFNAGVVPPLADSLRAAM
jgi:hypothetical protein